MYIDEKVKNWFIHVFYNFRLSIFFNIIFPFMQKIAKSTNKQNQDGVFPHSLDNRQHRYSPGCTALLVNEENKFILKSTLTLGQKIKTINSD